ncbi:hypothetical protein B0H16DRAFT_154703 [Mycena metata]|uniref:PHD-type domain-containing protein n=1 Tax=Mycena metata TaxID=1033252 RepID=A0AAD7I590_9AGAR|nr:hypothetical protein B0H16DRAFT_154190 [Mycena metata]KAJ7734252.1 hypothetical protein B0H16DRAFT_154703 [Mycena metata]
MGRAGAIRRGGRWAAAGGGGEAVFAGGAARQCANALGGPARGAVNGGSANADAGDEIRCLCGSSVDDGFSVACDVCGRCCLAACFGIVEGSVPEEWRCWVCAPGDFPSLPNVTATTNPRRRASISARRAGTVDPAAGTANATANGNNASDTAAEEQLAEDERMQCVLIEDDIVPHANTQRKLRAYAATWRGVSALSPTPPETASLAQGHTPFVFPAPPAALPTLPQSFVPFRAFLLLAVLCIPFGSAASTSTQSASSLPPTCALHTASRAPSSRATPRKLHLRFNRWLRRGLWISWPGAAYLPQPLRPVQLGDTHRFITQIIMDRSGDGFTFAP